MPIAGIRVLVIGKAFKLPYECVHLDGSSQILGTLATFRPDVIVTSDFMPGPLLNFAFEWRKRWIHVDQESTDEAVAKAVESCYAANLYGSHEADKGNPLVSVYTGCYNTGDYLSETYQSLKDQTYPNWEWIAVDDFSTDQTWERLVQYAKEDPRVRPFRSGHRQGKIGAVKDLATRLASGVYLVELDHDDRLTDFALDEIVKAFQADPAIGMVYSNCSNFFEDGTFHRFTDDFWKNRYRETEYRGKKWVECLQPDVYDRFGPNYWDQFGYFLTVGINHVRAFRASTFRELGGYNPRLSVADDWDLYVRFFLRSKCHLIPKMLYLYLFRDAWQNSTFTRNKSIQDHLAIGRGHYAAEFDAFNKKRLGQVQVQTEVKASETKAEEPYTLSNVSFVVLQAAEHGFTLRCLESIKAYAPDAEVVLVGNGIVCAPEAVKLASKYVQLEMNVGFSAGCNRGAMEASRRLLCFMNDDARFVDDTPSALVRAISADIPIVGPYSNRAKPPQGDIPRERVPQHDSHPSMVTGLCMMVPAELFHLIGGFDPRLSNWEDDAFCLKAALRGKLCKVVAGTWVEHERHASFRALGVDPNAEIARNKKKFDSLYPKIRVIAISKNEESCVQDFFRQFLPATRDWCLLDTGSTDKTVEKAKEIGVRVETAEFKNFAQARNEAVKRFGDGADWIVMLDPDERLDEHCIANLPALLGNTQRDVFLAPLEAVYPNGQRRAFVPKPFAFRAKPNIFWIFKVHEKLVGSGHQALIENAKIEHIVAFHEDGRRQAASGLYDTLMKEEPYFTDPDYKSKILSAWPILDYDRMDDPRIKKISIGPLVSVVIPTYRRPELLQKAIESVLEQDYEPLEIVAVGDSDDTLRKLGAGALRVFNLPKNHGAGGAAPRNHGIAMAAGQLIAYCDDDNAWEPDHLSSLYEALMDAKADWAFSSMKAVGHVFMFEKPEKGKLDTSCVLHKKLLIKEHGWWRDRIEAGYAHDWEFFSRWLERPWAATGMPTLIYNAETSGQKDYLVALAKNSK